jgi:hypothetical protein
MKRTIFLLLLSILFINIFAQTPQGTPQTPPQGFFKPDPAKWETPTGPYKVVMEVDKTLSDHTIYRPEDLKKIPEKDKLPIL